MGFCVLRLVMAVLMVPGIRQGSIAAAMIAGWLLRAALQDFIDHLATTDH